MCRLSAYLGSEISLKQFILDPEHSLYIQSWQPQELHYAKFNADGFGVGWYQDDGSPARYRNSHPIWSDANLSDLATAMKRPLWLAMVRSATANYATGLHNTQPFSDERMLFLHNGNIQGFAPMRQRLLAELDADIEQAIVGSTDSEHLFALVRQRVRQDAAHSIENGLRQAIAWMHAHIGDHTAMLNIVISTLPQQGKATLYALRCAIGEAAPSLYYRHQGNSCTIASERLTGDKDWQRFAENTLLTFDQTHPPKLLAI